MFTIKTRLKDRPDFDWFVHPQKHGTYAAAKRTV